MLMLEDLSKHHKLVCTTTWVTCLYLKASFV